MEPTAEAIKDGSYKPLSRPLYIYINKNSLSRPEIKEFVNFYLTNANSIVPEVEYIALPEAEYKTQLELIK
jgi:phosphate transport system substrate-binding protein